VQQYAIFSVDIEKPDTLLYNRAYRMQRAYPTMQCIQLDFLSGATNPSFSPLSKCKNILLVEKCKMTNFVFKMTTLVSYLQIIDVIVNN